ncbi:MAG: bifunctional DNA-formamidopyrimidine glycosylase/DNA-(apurinic or apyrimidinic site) lyase [Deltaproteobacteria bacterium]|nr:bifunctional DNA-formamidopyrimidine glycosylase/DNA-(apurinic or apyrimidinic site) lyase [Deltaproteobacteria bacterium]
MPELPEVEVIRLGLAPRLMERRFVRVTVGAKSLRRQSPVRELEHWLLGRKLTDLSRRGKYLVFALEGGVTLLVHLGMTGHLLLGSESKPLPQLDHIHLVFHLDNGLELIYQDIRRFGQVLVFPPGVPPAPLREVGREPFSRQVTPQWLSAQARGRSRPIKNFLLDGRILAGIGNIYACEILFAAGVHPATPAGRLSLKDWGRILKDTRRILKEAIRQGGTTVSNYLNSHGEAGLFQVQLLVYGKESEHCRRCGAPIVRLIQSGRSTFFCSKCQKMPD